MGVSLWRAIGPVCASPAIALTCLSLYVTPALASLCSSGEHASLTAPDGAAEDRFGHAVGTWGDIVIAGAYQDDDLGNNAGAAYLYRLDSNSTNTWNFELKFLAPDGAASDQFGWTVAAVGAPGHNAGRGAVYVYRYQPGPGGGVRLSP